MAPSDTGDSGEDTATHDTADSEDPADSGDSDTTDSADSADTGASDPCLPPETGGDTGPVISDLPEIATDALRVLYGAPDTQLGQGIAAIPDLDGDGVPELAVGDDDDVWLVPSVGAGVRSVGTGAWRWSPAGSPYAPPDSLLWFDDDLLVSRGAYDVADAAVERLGLDGACGGRAEVVYLSNWDDLFEGRHLLDAAGDTDGDGIADLVSASSWHGLFEAAEEVRVHTGPLTGPEMMDRHGVRLFTDLTCSPQNGIGNAVGVGDTDGDGLDDVFVSWGELLESDWAGLLYRGPFLSDRVAEDADRHFVFDDSPQDAFAAAPGDLDGDGLADLALGLPEVGVVLLASGVGDGEWTSADTLAILTGQAADGFGAVIARLDARADEGVAGVMVGAENGLWVGFGPFSGAVELDQSWAVTDVYSGGSGVRMLGSADLSGDGVADAVVTDHYASLGAFRRGAVYVLDGSRW